MRQENKQSLNVPSVSVTTVRQLLTELYSSALENGVPLKSLPTPFFWGPAGVGKSEGVAQMAKAVEERTGKRVKVTDVRLLLFSPVDLRGVPVADGEKRFTNWLMPRIFQMDPDRSVVNLLFLDELSAAPQSVQAAAYQICLDRRIGEFMLPDNCIVIAAGNRTTDQSVSYKMPKALCNRLMHFDVKSDYAAWREWAVAEGISDKVLAYLAFDPSRLCVEPESSDLAYATPRSWTFVSRLLQTAGDRPSVVRPLIAACVGNDTAMEFLAFCRGFSGMPSVAQILSGRCTELPKTHDVTYALISALVLALRQRGEELSMECLNNACDYVQRLPKDFAAAFFQDLKALPAINRRLMKCESFQRWLGSLKRR